MQQNEQIPFRKMIIDDFLDALASDAPAPGGGAAAGLLGAQACALAEMACHFTLSNKKYESVHEKAAMWLQIFTEARSIMLDLADEDAKNFKALMETLQLPKTDETRTEKVQAALEKAVEAPSQTAQTLSDLLEIFTALIREGNKNLITDSLIATECAISAIRAAILNVRINLKSIKNEFFVREAEETIRTWENAISAADAVLTYQVTL